MYIYAHNRPSFAHKLHDILTFLALHDNRTLASCMSDRYDEDLAKDDKMDCIDLCFIVDA